jgi:ribosome assembly protein 1
VYVLSALYDPLNAEQGKNMLEARVEALYMMMGRGLEPKSAVSAGNIVAIRGLGQHILKSGTLSTTPICWPFARMNFQAAPIVRVAIEPSDPSDMGALSRGLRLLNRADPFVEVSVSASGEHVIAAAGEVHLERCIKDLKERFARIELSVSPPLVEFRETADIEGYIAEVDKTTVGQTEFVEKTTPNGRCMVRVHLTRLPGPLIEVCKFSWKYHVIKMF